MRKICLAAVAVALAAIGLAAPQPASADGENVAAPAPARVHRTQHVKYVRGLWPGGPDPYAYAYARSRYYPYYDSAYWVPRGQMRDRSYYPNRLPEYWSSWGYPLTCKVRGGRNCGVPYRPQRAHLHPRAD